MPTKSTLAVLILSLTITAQHGGVMYHSPQWSPDGRSIVFMRDGSGGTQIWIMKADGAEQRCLTCR